MTEAGFSQIGRYQLHERLGAGGMARVYKAWDTTLQRWVALKVLHEHLAEDPAFVERFEREARFVAGFNHPNIIQVYDFASTTRDDAPLCYMVMSYIPGSTLRTEMDASTAKDGGLTRSRTLQIARNLTDALGYAHERGMAHRDVKPGNVLINEKGLAILTDFGIARLAQTTRLTQEGTSTGTPAYMSPEQAGGEAGDSRSDLYSLCVILFEMLTGEPPYDDEGTMAVMLKHLTGDIPVYSERAQEDSPALDAFFLRGLAKKPETRFQTAGELEQAFEAALNGVLPATVATGQSGTMPTVPAAAPRFNTSPAYPSPPAPMAALTRRSHLIRRLAPLVGALGLLVLFAALITRIGASEDNTAADVTAQPASVTGEVFFNASFDPNVPETAWWPQDAEPPFVQEITEDGFYRLSTDFPFTAETVVFTGGDSYDHVLIFMEAQLDPSSAPASAYGIVFRYLDSDNYNVFAVDGEGRFSIWVREAGAWRELRGIEGENWTRNEFVRAIGEQNRLTLEVRGDTFAGYVNNRPVFRLTDATLEPGHVGIYIASDDGASNVLIDQYSVRDSTSSMTGP
ncbi:MAG TPA: serine/threonine-protein kinase [Candidatus Limnocylindrales bacterium]|nr:serine/threonine-protein kinase [Candidatus Limnocylindrales bacterium]